MELIIIPCKIHSRPFRRHMSTVSNFFFSFQIRFLLKIGRENRSKKGDNYKQAKIEPKKRV